MDMKGQNETDPRIERMVLYAWVGEDEMGSGEVGLKQGTVPAGNIALVSCKEGKMDQPYIVEQLRIQASIWGKPIRLCRFVFEKELLTLEPGRS